MFASSANNSYQCHDVDNLRDLQVRVYSRPGITEQVKFAAEISVPIHKWLETETGIPYPLPKMGRCDMNLFGLLQRRYWILVVRSGLILTIGLSVVIDEFKKRGTCLQEH